jgi:hypothetical protein
MGRTVEELDASLSLDELYMWVAYSNGSPWGEDRADWRNAQTNWLMTSLWGDGKKKHKITDFLLQFDKKKDKIKPTDGVDLNKWNYLVLQAMFGGSKR